MRSEHCLHLRATHDLAFVYLAVALHEPRSPDLLPAWAWHCQIHVTRPSC